MRLLYISLLLVTVISCNTKTETKTDNSSESISENGNQALYNQVMDVHDEVMPKTENIYNITKNLKAKLEVATSDAEQLDLQSRIAYMDSVNKMMMDWMHNFQPMPDSVSEETARAYYETQLEEIKKVKEAILTALEKEKANQ